MKRVPRKNEKEITYFGIDLVVPKYIKYVVVDANGECKGYSSKPEYGKLSDGSMAWGHRNGVCLTLMLVHLECEHPGLTLRGYE